MDLVVGGGAIQGCEPAEYLLEKNRDFILVDSDSNCLAVRKYGLKQTTKISGAGQFFVRGDLSTSLALLQDIKPEYVFPTSPIHLVSELAKIEYALKPWNEAVDELLPYLPGAVVVRAGRGELALSFNRDGDCVEKCESPKVFTEKMKFRCPMTHPRPCTMDQLMRYACPEGYILFSHSVSPGLGAFKGKEILDFLEWIERKERFVLGTSCNCHGIFWGFKKDVQHSIRKENGVH
jgi:hypothetical protein